MMKRPSPSPWGICSERKKGKEGGKEEGEDGGWKASEVASSLLLQARGTKGQGPVFLSELDPAIVSNMHRRDTLISKIEPASDFARQNFAFEDRQGGFFAER